MKRYITIALGVILAGASSINTGSAQQGFGGRPTAIVNRLRADNTPLRILPSFNIDDLKAQARWQGSQGGAPIVGRLIKKNINFIESARQLQGPNGEQIFQLAIEMPDALAININYSDFKIPKGARLFLISKKGNDVLGAYTYDTNPQGGTFSTDLTEGDRVVLQYEPGTTSINDLKLNIQSFGYHFNVAEIGTPRYVGEYGSDICQVNAHCSEGDAWRKQQDGIVQIYQLVGDVYTVCSGTLLNNTNKDYTPYILSAGHCALGKKVKGDEVVNCEVTPEDMKQWIFRFHYVRPNCENNEDAQKYAFTMVGAQQLAYLPINGYSDGMLMKLLKPIPDYYGVFYNGWDRTGNDVPSAVGLHHPKGDAMKISTSDTQLETATWYAEEADGTSVGAKGAHWMCRFVSTEHGHCVTEGGSSGSGLFDQNKRLIGDLSGGSSDCRRLMGKNFYGKLSFHWDAFKEEGQNKRMDIYLDPKDNGKATILDGQYKDGAYALKPIKNLRIEYSNEKIVVRWDNPEELEKAPEKFAILLSKDNGKPVRLPATEKSFEDKKIENSETSRRYSIAVEYKGDPSLSQMPISKPMIITAGKASAFGVKDFKTEVKDGKVVLSWKKPVNIQIVGATNTTPKEAVNANKVDYRYSRYNYEKEAYFGRKFPGFLFSDDSYRIIGVRYLSARSSRIFTDTKIILRNGYGLEKKPLEYVCDPKQGLYEETVNPNQIKEKEWATVFFKKPVKIDPAFMLNAGVKITTRTNFDQNIMLGKVENDMLIENVFSHDGLNWANMKFAIPDNNNSNYSAFERPMLFELIIDNGDGESVLPEIDKIPSSYLPICFPKVQGYRIKKNGEEIARVKDGTFSYSDVNGNAKDNYSVEVIYSDGSIVTSNDHIIQSHILPSLTSNVVTETLEINNSEMLAGLEIYGMNGQKLASFGQEATVSIENLDSGIYLVRIISTEGLITTQKIIKK